MQCPNCFDEEVSGNRFERTVKRVHLEMEEVCNENGFNFYQCPRCLMTRKRKSGFFTSGVIENTTTEEANRAVEVSTKNAGSALGAIVGIGIGILLIGAIASASEAPKKNE